MEVVIGDVRQILSSYPEEAEYHFNQLEAAAAAEHLLQKEGTRVPGENDRRCSLSDRILFICIIAKCAMPDSLANSADVPK